MQKLFYQWAGVVILSLIGWGVSLVPHVTNWRPASIIWGIAFLWLVATFIYWITHRKTLSKTGIYSIISILDRMDKRLNQLAQMEKDKKINWKAYKKTNDKIINLFNLSLPRAASVNEAQKEISQTIKEVEQKLAEYSKTKPTRVERMPILLAASRLIDSDGFGLTSQRQMDRQYSKLSQDIDSYFDDYKDIIDKELKNLIELHSHLSESSANFILVKHRTVTILKLASYYTDIDQFLPPSFQADLESMEDDAKCILRDIRVDIGQYIRKLDRPQNEQKN